MTGSAAIRTAACLAVLAMTTGAVSPAAAQSVQDIASEACLKQVNALAGGGARIVKVHEGTSLIVSLSAPGSANFTCITNAAGKPIRVMQDDNSSR